MSENAEKAGTARRLLLLRLNINHRLRCWLGCVLMALPLLLYSLLADSRGRALGWQLAEGGLTESVDPEGYLLYCPCMGRFGNQADHFLGALGFAKGLGRTLVIPPWVEYRTGHRGSTTVPFDAYFNVSRVTDFHKAITMEDFFSRLADQVWPPGRRMAFCYMVRRGPEADSCNAKDGNPFGPFWDSFGVSFDGSQTYGPLSYDVHHQNAAHDWRQRFPGDQFPVLAFTGAPASFPVQVDNLPLQQYLVFNTFWEELARNWVRKNLPAGPFIGVHLRNGLDWSRACEHTASTEQLFSSPQCLGYRNEHGSLTLDLCAPSDEQILRQLVASVRHYNALSVFVASDNDHMVTFLSGGLGRAGLGNVRIVRQEGGSGEEEPSPHLDLAILTTSNYFIGNCISSFTAFVKRSRDVEGLPSGFWAYPPDNGAREEL